MAALGGALGLFTGIAIRMLFEIMELAGDLVLNVWCYLNKPADRKDRKI